MLSLALASAIQTVLAFPARGVQLALRTLYWAPMASACDLYWAFDRPSAAAAEVKAKPAASVIVRSRRVFMGSPIVEGTRRWRSGRERCSTMSTGRPTATAPREPAGFASPARTPRPEGASADGACSSEPAARRPHARLH